MIPGTRHGGEQSEMSQNQTETEIQTTYCVIPSQSTFSLFSSQQEIKVDRTYCKVDEEQQETDNPY